MTRYFLELVLIATLLLTGCNRNLDMQLSTLERKLAHTQTRMRKLQEEIAQREIIRIRKELTEFQLSLAAGLIKVREPLFAEERESLARIAHRTPSCAPDALAVLDEILALITTMSNSNLRK